MRWRCSCATATCRNRGRSGFGMRKLLPGSYLTLSTEVSVGVLPAPTYYWRARDLANAGLRTDLDDQSAAEELDGQLRRAVAGQMVADVPLGAFLSGGVDSSTIVALMQQQSRRPVRSFSIGFAESDYDEAVHAKAVAAHLGTDHTELYVSPRRMRWPWFRALPEMFDEPFGDSSQIPTHLVAMPWPARHVTVSLSGDGGDELFGGYNRYSLGARDLADRIVDRLPRLLAWAGRPRNQSRCRPGDGIGLDDACRTGCANRRSAIACTSWPMSLT
jgi:asparagine synthase (glutamine-hydrolysing)